jgi:hypothetical protein
MTPLGQSDLSGAAQSLLLVAVDCDGPGLGGCDGGELLLTQHFKRGQRYLAWDLHRQCIGKVKKGRQVRTVVMRRPLDPAVTVEVGVVVPEAGYVSMFSSAAV